MAASASISAALAMLVPAPTGTGNDTRQALDASVSLSATTDTIAQISILPDDGITSDDQLIEIQLVAVAKSVTADNTTEVFTCVAHGFADGQAVQVGGTVIPTGLSAGVIYYVDYVGVDTFSLSATRGGAVLPFTTDGTSVTVRAFGATVINPTYPSIGPAQPVQVKDMVNGTPDDFTKVKALQIILRPLDTAANALGSVQLTAGDPAERYAHFNLPLLLDYTAGDEENWPTWVAALPEGFAYDTSYHLICRTKAGESNVNCLIIINLLGN